MTKEQAYDTARREFYSLRQEEEVERRIAKEEAQMVGAYFGKNFLQVGVELEDAQYERWKKWATRQIAAVRTEQSQAYTTFGDDEASAENIDLEEEIAEVPLAEGVPVKR